MGSATKRDQVEILSLYFSIMSKIPPGVLCISVLHIVSHRNKNHDIRIFMSQHVDELRPKVREEVFSCVEESELNQS